MISNSKVWTTATENGISRASTAAVHPTLGDNPYAVGIQSRFRRKYFHKIIFISLIFIILILLIGIIVLACQGRASRVCETTECLRAAANFKLSMDQSVDPCEDFYKFTCGNWAEEHPRPDSAMSNDWFSEKQVKIMRQVRSFLQSNATPDEPLPVNQTRQVFSACMDTETMDKIGLKPIYKYLKMFNLPIVPTILNLTEVDYSTYNFDWIKSVAAIKRYFGMDVMVGFDLMPDPENRSVYRMAIGTPEVDTGIPFNNNNLNKAQRIRGRLEIFGIHPSADESVILEEDDAEEDEESMMGSAYGRYVSEVISAIVLDYKNTTLNEESVANILTAGKMIFNTTRILYQLNQAAENASKSKDTDPMNDIMNMGVSELQNSTDTYISPHEGIPLWEKYITLLFLDVPEVHLDLEIDKLLTSSGDLLYLQTLVEFVANTSLAKIELYIWWAVVEELIIHTTTDMRNLHNQYAKSITSTEGSLSRSLYCANGVNQLMGMAVSYSIADRDFLKRTKPNVELMLMLIRTAFNDLVATTTWMDAQTKAATLEKSAAMRSLIGFPEWILEKATLLNFYKGINVTNTTHLDNMMHILHRNMLEKLTEFRNENKFGWATSPTNVNAFHTFQANAITIPLAILQYPFYHLGLEALNYGAIGTILGHELTHGFDDSGRHFDKNGNIRQWWTNKTIDEYENRTSCFVKFYNNYYLPEVSEYINGELTLGENIADNGGLREAFYAYKLYQQRNGREDLLPGFENYTHEQLFFMSYGNLWCETMTTVATKWALEDSHCPGRIRLHGVLSNSPEFASTFKCKKGSGMYPPERCRLW
ncbi:endothelin-converting enzyme 2 [Phlebotomus papatasi]|uniref:endothelin-converting enzyme 2 n=1 Tax=Phlebotomus papatasi TaxID=29031 RepID=UPI0024833631|nr:endothelin-converting enzyme 2 [Phlebotomus papatasi]